MISRYDVATFFSENWSLLNWKGDDHTKGVYFDNEYGYLIEPTYAVRVRHSEQAPAVFFIPADNQITDAEVITSYPYENMTKITKKYNLLFQGNYLKDSTLGRLFDVKTDHHAILPAEPLIRLLNTITNKRERDRSLLLLTITGNDVEASLMEKKKEKAFINERFEITSDNACKEGEGMIYMTVNANTILHALSLFYSKGHIHFSISHDRIKLTSYASALKVEAVISTPKISNGD